MYAEALKTGQKIFSVAPMLDWTDKHCRFLHRLLTRQALLYTEMIVADAAIRGQRALSLGEMDALLRQMEQTGRASQCNHGRPTYVELKLTDIERLFGRR